MKINLLKAIESKVEYPAIIAIDSDEYSLNPNILKNFILELKQESILFACNDFIKIICLNKNQYKKAAKIANSFGAYAYFFEHKNQITTPTINNLYAVQAQLHHTTQTELTKNATSLWQLYEQEDKPNCEDLWYDIGLTAPAIKEIRRKLSRAGISLLFFELQAYA